MTSILNKPIEICSLNPVTGYKRDGYCTNTEGDYGTHVVCAKVNNNFLQFTKKQGNNLTTPQPGFPGLKSGDKWCLCARRWEEARKAGLAPPVDLEATDKSALNFNTYNTYLKYNLHTRKKGGKRTKTRKQFRFNPNNPKLSFNVYIDKNPSNTIPIHYKTLVDVKNTITNLEKLYKANKYTHKRIWAVAMIMKVRLEVLKEKKPEEYKLAKRYFEFLSKRTKMDEDDRHKKVFK